MNETLLSTESVKLGVLKLAGLSLPVLAVSAVIGGLAVWQWRNRRAIHELRVAQGELDAKLVRVTTANEALDGKLQTLNQKLSSPPPVQAPLSSAPAKPSPLKTSRLGMLKQVLEENLKLRKSA